MRAINDDTGSLKSFVETSNYDHTPSLADYGDGMSGNGRDNYGAGPASAQSSEYSRNNSYGGGHGSIAGGSADVAARVDYTLPLPVSSSRDAFTAYDVEAVNG